MNRSIAAFASLAFTLSTATIVAPRANSPHPIAPPTSGLIVDYRYWPVQYVQFVGTELPYSMITLEADTAGKQPAVLRHAHRARHRQAHPLHQR